MEIEDLLSALVQCGYTREDQIEGPGQFSRRGGIVDFYSPSASAPVRVEFWGTRSTPSPISTLEASAVPTPWTR